jgi:hypothetical protein
MVNGQATLYCSNDKKEDQLLEKLNDITKSNNQNEGKNSKPVNMKLVYDYIVVEHPGYFTSALQTEQAYIHYAVALPQQTAAIIAPPPRAWQLLQ